MRESSSQVVERRPANLTTLQRELEAIAARVKSEGSDAKAWSPEAFEPVLVIRGK